MKREKIIPNIALVLLVLLTLFQINLLFLKFPKENKLVKPQENYDSTLLFLDILKPKKIIANFGENKHNIIYEFKNIYSDYLDTLREIFNNLDNENIKEISSLEYMKLQEEKSLVFKFNHRFTGNIYINFMGKNKVNSEIGNHPLDEVYISNNIAVLVNESGYYLMDFKSSKKISETLNSIKDVGFKNFTNFYEKFAIEKNIYIPASQNISLRNIYYSDNINSVSQTYRNNLAERFLNTSIDYIKEISENNQINFIYENSYLKILNDGIIQYSNQNKLKSPKRNLFLSLRSSINFISKNIGTSENLYLYKVEEIKEDENLGYKFYFNLTEDMIPVIIDGEDNQSYIEMEIFDYEVKSFKQIYRKSNLPLNDEFENIEMEAFEDIILANIGLFTKGEIEMKTLLSKIEDVNLVYIDNLSTFDRNKLNPALRILYEGRELYFSLKNGRFLMEI